MASGLGRDSYSFGLHAGPGEEDGAAPAGSEAAPPPPRPAEEKDDPNEPQEAKVSMCHALGSSCFAYEQVAD